MLQIGQLTEQVTVTGGAPVVQTEEASVGSVIDSHRIAELPLNGRQFLQLTLLVPGVNPGAPGGRQRTERGTLESAISVNGARENANRFLLDGTLNTDPNFNIFVISPNVDAIQEFKVQTADYSAQFGSQAGAQINVVTRSGTNSFHGTAYEFLRNEKLDAKNYFDRSDRPIPPFKQNQYGFTTGGPILRDRTFFFGSFEGFRQRKAQSSVATAPNAALREGDFSNFRNAAGQLISIYDPATVKPDPANPGRFTRTPFANNVIPANRISPVARNILKFVDLPNLPDTRPFGAGLYLNNDPRRQDQEQWSVRVDQQIRAKNNFFARYSFTDERAEVPGSWSTTGDARGARGQILTLNDTHVFGPRAVNELKFGFIRLRNNILSKNAFKSNLPFEVGIQDQKNLKPIDWGVPSIDIVGYTTIGDRTFGVPTQTRNNVYQVAENFSLERGRHSFKLGLEAIRYQLNNLTDNFYLPTFSFRGTPFTAGVAGDGTSGGSLFADFLLGHPNLTQRSDGDSLIYLRRLGVSPYVQDDWKLSERLTLNLGLRYDLLTPWVERYDRFGGVLVSNILGAPAPRPVQAGKGVPRGIVFTDKNNFAPRVGIAYRPFGDSRTAIRAGYGVFYDTQIGNTTVDFVRNPPFQVRLIADSPDNVTPQLVLTRLIPENFSVSSSYFGQRQDFPLAYIQHWNLSVQREIVPNLSAEAAYIGTTGRKLSSSIILNLPAPGPGAFGPRRPFTPFGIDSIFQYALPYVNSFYHSLQLKLERRFSAGLSVLGAYTFSKSIDDAQEIRGGGTVGQQLNNWDLVGEGRGRSNFDMRHRFVTSYLWELPFGPGKRFGDGTRGSAARLIGGWSAYGIVTLSTGFPLTVFSGVDNVNMGVGSLSHPDQKGEPELPRSERDPSRWFNTAAFEAAPQYKFGTSGRNTVGGPGVGNVDFAVVKSTGLTERHRLQFRAELFNLFNTPHFGLPVNVMTSGSFGRVTSAADARVIQFALKYIF